MFPQVYTKDPSAVEVEAASIFQQMFPRSDSAFIGRAFSATLSAFSGKYRDYQAIDARYHDLEHTMQGTLCMVRLLKGRHFAGVRPLLTPRMFELGLWAILLHDTGYLKKRGDTQGTGAKYTLVHVARSSEFAAELLGRMSDPGYEPHEITAVQNMIRCTGVNADLASIPFQNKLEQVVGFALGTADLLGQMAADDYIDKLPVLFSEFEESQQCNQGHPGLKMIFTSAEDLMQKTPGFYQFYVLPKVDRDFQGMYQFLNHPYPDGPNLYIESIEANLAQLKERLEPRQDSSRRR